MRQTRDSAIMEVGKQRSSSMFSFAVGLVLVILAIETGYLHWKCIKMEENFTDKIEALGNRRTGIETMKWLGEILEFNQILKQGRREKRDTERQGSRRRSSMEQAMEKVLLNGLRAFVIDVVNKVEQQKTADPKICKNKNVVCIKGEPGPRGPNGFTGLNGAKGEQGRQGLPGLNGRTGLSGRKGDRGFVGMRGTKGDRGARGFKGDQGDPGDCEGQCGPPSKPNITTKFSETLIKSEMTRLSLTCYATGSPTPQIRWEFGGRDTDKRYSFPSNGRSLLMKDVRETDRGVIKCIAENNLGKDTQETTLVVHTRPRIMLSKLSAEPVVGQPFEIHCNASGSPLPKLSWRKAAGNASVEQELSSNGRSLRLLIRKQETPKVNGKYICIAENDVGKDTKSVDIKFDFFPGCAALRKRGFRQSGIYSISADGVTPFNAYCDMQTSNGGWTVIQRRKDGSVDFFKKWNEYKNGFGNLTGEFWLGNDKIHELTKRKDMMIRFDLEDVKGAKAYAEYAHFYVNDEDSDYKVHVNSYSGTAGDSFGKTNGLRFTTIDQDNDNYRRGSCSKLFHGAWWYDTCHETNLNGKYLNGPHSTYADGIEWKSFRGYRNSLKATEMKIRPKSFTLKRS